MENYAYNYPDSGDSSPRFREIDFENPPTGDDQNYKPKFMCSYGGKIQPRPHDNLLSYVGGETKILSVDRNIKFSAMVARLSALCEISDVIFKYQLPGEDIDALISVSNDDDLEHLMHEYDRLYRATAKPSRMRLFLFPVNAPNAFNPGTESLSPDTVKPPSAAANKLEFSFGLEKGVVPPTMPPQAAKFHDPADRVVGSGPVENQRQLPDFQRLQIAEQEQDMYRRKFNDNIVSGYPAGDYYMQKLPENVPSSNSPATASHPGVFWPEKQVPGGGTPSPAQGGPEQPMYVIPAPGTLYHAPLSRPQPSVPTTQSYFPVQRKASDVYCEQPVFSAVPPPHAPLATATPSNLPPPQPVKVPAYSEGFGGVRPGGVSDNLGAYAKAAYDNGIGRQVYYAAQGGAVYPPPYQAIAPAISAVDNRGLPGGGVSLGQEVKVLNRVSQ